MSHEKKIVVESIKSMTVLEDDSCAEFLLMDADGDEHAMQLTPALMMSFLEYCSAGTYSIKKRAGGFECLPVEAVRTHGLLGTSAIAVEIAFSSQGLLVFQMPRPLAEKLRSEMESRLETLATPGPAKNEMN